MIARVCLLALWGLLAAGQTQLEMNQAARAEYDKADAELNQVYTRILRENRGETAFVAKMRAAQRAWVAFRDAHLEALYPKPGSYGTIYPLCRFQTLTELTKERIKQLREWVDGVDETDSCSGSRKAR
jgi:uncharacterized protein YecT (DUF1311 family)